MAQIASDIKPTSLPGKTSEKVTEKTVTALGNLINFLPTGTFFLYVFLSPALTNNGECRTSNKYLTSIFIGLCGFWSCFSWFTDSYIDKNGKVQYGIVTKKGLYPLSDSETSSVDLSKYKLRLRDFVYAFLSIIVLAIIVLMDRNTVECFYPSFESSQKQLIMVLPPVVGAIASGASALFPNNRRGIGYPPRKTSQSAAET